MRWRAIVSRPWLILIVLAVGSCNRPPPVTLIDPGPPPAPAGEFTLLAPLAAGKPTHVAVDSKGNFYLLQELGNQQDLLYTGGEGQMPRLGGLETQTILRLLDSPKGTGAIQSIVCGVDDRVYFYFAGNDAKKSLACLGVFDPRLKQVKIVANADQLQKASGLGLSLDLARGTLLPAPGAVLASSDPLFSTDSLWLWLRHSDQGVIVRIDPHYAWEGTVGLRCVLNGATAGQNPLLITSSEDLLTLGPNRTFYYLDRPHAILWKLTAPWLATVPAGPGESLIAPAQPVIHLNDVPNSLTPPAFDEKRNLFMLAGESLVMSPQESGNPSPLLTTIWPAFLVIDADAKVQTIDRDHLAMPTLLAPEMLQPACLIADRHSGAWLVYDQATGALLKLKVSLRKDE